MPTPSGVRATHTLAALPVPRAFYDLVLRKLTDAGYEVPGEGEEEFLSLHGIGICPEETPTFVPAVGNQVVATVRGSVYYIGCVSEHVLVRVPGEDGELVGVWVPHNDVHPASTEQGPEQGPETST
jgi:hypothetical protein